MTYNLGQPLTNFGHKCLPRAAARLSRADKTLKMGDRSVGCPIWLVCKVWLGSLTHICGQERCVAEVLPKIKKYCPKWYNHQTLELPQSWKSCHTYSNAAPNWCHIAWLCWATDPDKNLLKLAMFWLCRLTFWGRIWAAPNELLMSHFAERIVLVTSVNINGNLWLDVIQLNLYQLYPRQLEPFLKRHALYTSCYLN